MASNNSFHVIREKRVNRKCERMQKCGSLSMNGERV
uniref:Uncharacterized protein n=1 Tax=Anguilla anguilla TaxID=7936 RepID=A0A0E9RQH7_ANGAN